MEAEFWHARWERNEIGFHQDLINPHLQRFWPTLKAPAGSRVFVPLCGKSNDLLWLAGERMRVIGVEISPIAVKAFFAENHLAADVSLCAAFELWRCDEIEILQGDFFALESDLLGDVALCYDRASLVALPPSMRRAYASKLASLMGPGARVLLVTFAYPQHEMDGPPFSVADEEVSSLYCATFDIERVHSESVIEANPRFKERGLTSIIENVYLLTRKPA